MNNLSPMGGGTKPGTIRPIPFSIQIPTAHPLCNTSNIKQTEIYKALNLKLKPLGRIKMKTFVKERTKVNTRKDVVRKNIA
ncbi:MAG: hypothetical protein KAI40_03730 [Desulfobacterales bacterium]|nr:hypothetical protein [Desulfobacterales bacterium]